MYWADKIADEIIKSGKHKPYWVDDMKTPSGFAHVGSLLGPVLHSLVYRALKDVGKKATFTFAINDFDPMDEIAPGLDKSFFQYLGCPLKKAPSPDKSFGNMADYYANDFIEAFRSLGVEAKVLSSWDMYQEREFDKVIREALNHSEKIQDIYRKVSGSRKKEAGWLPFQPICESCGKVGTTRTFAWDGKEVSYKCEPSMVTWAKGCGHEGKVSPFGGTGKLPWKVDWAAHWKVIGVTIEGAGKDHASAGGSYDIAMTLCKEVFNYLSPFRIPYEFILIGGRKMSSSKGLGLKAHDLVKILPPELGRFLFARNSYKKQSNFDPIETMAIPDLFDEYDKAAKHYWEKKDDLGRTFELSQIKDKIPAKQYFLPRFREVAQMMQMPNIDLSKYFEDKKGSKLSKEEKKALNERVKYAKEWLKDYAPKEAAFKILEKPPKSTEKLTAKQKEYLGRLTGLVENKDDATALEKEMYNLAQSMDLAAKDAFAAVYISLIDKTYGPKAAWLILGEKKKSLERFKEVAK